MSDSLGFDLELEQLSGYEFKVRFDTPGAAELLRNEKGRVRIGRLDATIRLVEEGAAVQHLERCLQQFEDFCIVTESVRQGIPVQVRVLDAQEAPLFSAG